MIDIENEVFNAVATAIRAKYSKAFVTGEFVKSPSQFPCVSVMEVDNQVYRNTRSSSETENHAQLRYEINVYTNDTKGKKTKGRDILNCADEVMKSLGFTRIMARPVSNEQDATIFRMVGRYRALVDNNHTIYRR